MSRKRWTESERAELRRRYPHERTAEISLAMGRSESSIYNQAFLMGLQKSPDYLEAKRKEEAKRLVEAGKAHRIRKGDKPWNAGKKGWQAGGDARKTQFRKGNMPQTWQPLGTEKTDKDGHLVRKVADTRNRHADWRKVHHLVWEEHNGPIPPGRVVAFKDGNPDNRAISNLELLTRAQLMERNSYLNLPKPLADLVRLRGALNRQINKRERACETK